MLNFLAAAIILISIALGQSHLSVPQSVWRIGVDTEFFGGDWKGPDGKEGINGMQSLWNNQLWTINEQREISGSRTTIKIDYGFSDRVNFSMTIPYFGSLKENKTFSVSPTDTTGSSPDSIIGVFHPSSRKNSGLGDVSLGLQFLLFGTPTWSEKGNYSIYGSLSVTLPSAERLGAYNSGSTDSKGVPLQFYELPIGHGLVEYSLSLSGEFYRRIIGRMATLRWVLEYSSFGQDQVNTPLSFVGFDESNPDSLNALIGQKHLYKHGAAFTGSFSGRFEVLPELLIFTAGMDWKFTGRGFYKSNSETWDNWMEYRQVKGNTIHSTKRAMVRQFVMIQWQNVDPIKKIGPLPFEVELGLIFSIPLLVRNDYNLTALRLGFTSYVQLW